MAGRRKTLGSRVGTVGGHSGRHVTQVSSHVTLRILYRSSSRT